MSALQVTAIVVSLGTLVVGVALLVRAVVGFARVFRLGAPAPGRTDRPAARTVTLLKEFLGHTRMARIPGVAVAHWVTMISFGLLFLTLVTAVGQLFDASFALPLIGHFPPLEWLTEFFAWGGLVGICYLMFVRQKNHPRRAAGTGGRRSRFFGSTFWQAYYIELTILGVVVCIIVLRGLEYALATYEDPGLASALHFPLTGWLGALFGGASAGALAEAIYLVAAIKIVISFAWMIVISLTPTMGVAWHRFLAFPNIWFKRHPDGRTSLAELQPMYVGGRAVTSETLEDVMDEDSGDLKMGVGAVEDFTWKGLLDFATCTECGRCQSQCPAWNTDKPLSPKLLVMGLRDHAFAKAPFLTATESARTSLPEQTTALAQASLVGATGYSDARPQDAYTPHGSDAVIDDDVLWSCTTCGACVEQCPVDIEHVDSIVDMRRHQVLIESAFPAELGGLFKNMESKSNPWGMAPKLRLDWAKGLPFDVPVVGADVEDLGEVDYLFWVGCAGAYEDRAKKTTRAVAELLHTAGVSFAVLGEGEACTGDSARRAGNEILFQMLAAQNVEMLGEAGATKIVVTCAHCFNTIKNEYPQLGGHYEVLHHTQLLNRLVREKSLVPLARPGEASAKDVASTAATVTYHDPCYLGRHNNVYAPPRELIGTLPGVELREMPRHGEKSFCCGAGGARMWMEEKLGSRVNRNRTAEAVATGADRIAVGCPFCRVMLSDGLTADQSEGSARDEVEVVDIAQMLLAAVRRGEESAPDESATTKLTGAGESPAEVAQAERAGGGAALADGASDDGADSTQAAEPAEPAAPAASKAMSASEALAAMQGGDAEGLASAPATVAEGDSTKPASKAMSATDALAAMQAGQGRQGRQDEPDEHPTTAPGRPPAGTATPAGGSGKVMSATEALAAMQARQTGPDTTTNGPTAPAPPEPRAEKATHEKPAPDTPAPAKPTPEKPAASTGGGPIMSATDALAAMQARQARPDTTTTGPTAPAPPEPRAEKATREEPAPAKPTPEKPAASTGGGRIMSATDALAAMQAGQAGSRPGSTAEGDAAAGDTDATVERDDRHDREAAREEQEDEHEDDAGDDPAGDVPPPAPAPPSGASPAPTIEGGIISATEALKRMRRQT